MTDQEFHAWCQTSSAGRKRQISRMLVDFCVKEKLYRDAAAVVSGGTDLFNSYSRRINDMIVSLVEIPESVSFTDDIQPILDVARDEIAFQQLWENNVLSDLPGENNTAPLRTAFRDTRKVCSRLSRDLTAISNYLKASTTAVPLQQKVAVAPDLTPKEVCHE
jgi:hypothetical protein